MHAEAESPCTVGNFGPGFDVLSLALQRRGDKVWIATAETDTVRVRGPGHERVPTDWARNSACASLDHLRRLTGKAGALEVVIEKGVPPGSGLGSSASSNASAVRAFARLHGLVLSPIDALLAAAAGEAVATGSAHRDDAAAALFGGLTIVGPDGPDALVRLRPPPIHLVVARPDVELPTREMRRLIPDALPKESVVRNLGNVARLVHACHVGDDAMLCRALDDFVSRPYRAPKVPLFAEAEKTAREHGALGFLLSGSGPAMIAAMPRDKDPRAVETALRDVFLKGGVEAEVFTTQPLPEVKDPAIPLPALR